MYDRLFLLTIQIRVSPCDSDMNSKHWISKSGEKTRQTESALIVFND